MCERRSKLTMKIWCFIVEIEKISYCFGISLVEFEYVNARWAISITKRFFMNVKNEPQKS